MESCSQCGACCKLFWINLDETEYNSRKYKTMFKSCGFVKDFSTAELEGANIIAQNDDGSCIYLKDNRCSIHKDRPNSCRKFYCTSDEPKFKRMIEKINDYKKKH